MATKGSSLFPKPSIVVPEVDQSDIDKLQTSISDLNAELKELEAKESDVTEVELKAAVDDAKAMIKAVEDAIAELKAKAPEVTKVIFDTTVKDLETSIAALPTTAQLDAVKTDVIAVQDKLKTLDTEKADKTAVEAANTAIKDVDTALKALAALPPEVSQQELDDAIADYTKKLKAADDAIAAANQSILSVTPVGAGKTLDLSSIKATGSGFWNGAALSGGPLNGGSGGSGRWAYSGDATTGDMDITVWTAPNSRQIEGGWVRSRVASNWGEWSLAPKASDFQITKGATTATTGENWQIAVGHLVTIIYVDVNKTIKLRPHNTTWDKVTQYVSAGGFTVPAKPANGASVVELKYNAGKAAWEAVMTTDPMDARLVAVEAKAATNEMDISNLSIFHRMAPSAGVGTNMLCSLEGDTVFVATATGTTPRAANCFVSAHSAATTPFYGRNYIISASWIPTGATKGSLLYLGNNGAISLTPPPIALGNIIQAIGRVNGSGQGILDINEPIFVGA